MTKWPDRRSESAQSDSKAYGTTCRRQKPNNRAIVKLLPFMNTLGIFKKPETFYLRVETRYKVWVN
jgi:hypothetical protein